MNLFRSVTVCPVRSLEVGDLIALEFHGGVISGKITGIPHCGYDLTPEQRQYMLDNRLNIPDNENAPLTSYGVLLLGKFVGDKDTNHPHHMYLDYDVNVAVFQTDRASDESIEELRRRLLRTNGV